MSILKECAQCFELTTESWFCRRCWMRLSFEQRQQFYKTMTKGGGYYSNALGRVHKALT